MNGPSRPGTVRTARTTFVLLVDRHGRVRAVALMAAAWRRGSAVRPRPVRPAAPRGANRARRRRGRLRPGRSGAARDGLPGPSPGHGPGRVPVGRTAGHSRGTALGSAVAAQWDWRAAAMPALAASPRTAPSGYSALWNPGPQPVPRPVARARPLQANQLQAELFETGDEAVQRRLVLHLTPQHRHRERRRLLERVQCCDDVRTQPSSDAERVLAAHRGLRSWQGKVDQSWRRTGGGWAILWG